MINKSYLLVCAVLMSYDNGFMLRIFLLHMVQDLFLPLHMCVLHYEAVHLAVSAAAVIGGVASR